ncbi:MAG: ABC transporter ATP-binding protein [Saprospiraceae bacterium]|nr:ABC transporter ATP-binding protein [Saprospiraceae bacterium]
MLLEFNNVTKTYGKTTVLNIENLSIDKGECVGIVGNNGAGKTTAFSLILDLIKASEGSVLTKGSDVSKTEDWKSYTSAFLDETFLIDFLTPNEYFDFVGGLHNWSKGEVKEFIHQFEEFFNGEILGVKKYIRDLSKGNQKKVGIVGSLIGNPEIIILDEPFASLDPSTQIRLKKIIRERLDKHTFLISSHDLTHVAEVCSRIVILEKGNMIMDNLKTEETIQKMTEYFHV